MVRVAVAVSLCAVLTTVGHAQTPQPFPRAGSPTGQRPAAPATPPTAAQQAVAEQRPPVSAPAVDGPSEAVLGVALYPTAQFLNSYDAGRGQRYYLFGTTASFAEVVGYYRVQTDARGDLVFRDPPTHVFTGGKLSRFRDETMAFPPSVTVKDWTSGGSAGYPNKAGAQPARFPTVIMIVPAPPEAAAAR